jgi:tRNA1Val (adenine37-N6)-methyltransferase
MPFTYQYSQPDDYRFSLDSVLMPEAVAKFIRYKKKLEDFKVLDLCAGCGVVGFELFWHERRLRNLDLLEVQEIYRAHFDKNLEIVERPEVNFQFFNLNYEAVLKKPEWSQKYDLIVCNPPYFKTGQGKLSPSDFKNRCRFFIDGSLENLFAAVVQMLKPQGEAYVLAREKITNENKVFIEKVAEIRGTDLLLIKPYR